MILYILYNKITPKALFFLLPLEHQITIFLNSALGLRFLFATLFKLVNVQKQK